MKRTAVVLLAIVSTAFAAGCASADHSWRGELDARLEAASMSIEKTLTEVGPGATKPEDFRSYENLGRELTYKAELIEGLDPPQRCARVQLKGLDHVKSSGHKYSQVGPPDFPWKLLRAGRVGLADDAQDLARIEREAETCE
jgi:hypothetical protein